MVATHQCGSVGGFTGILQADAYGGSNGIFDPSRPNEVITPALCWAHARRQFFEQADIAANTRRGKKATAISPIALEAVTRIDALFEIERTINGRSAEERMRVRQEQSAPLLSALEAWLREERCRLLRAAPVAGPIDYMLRRWDRFARFLDDGRVCLTNNAKERALRGFALGDLPSDWWLSRILRGLGCEEDASAQEIEAGTTIHGLLQQLEPRDLAFRLPVAPWRCERSADRCSVVSLRRVPPCVV
jgi:hypothetical protein